MNNYRVTGTYHYDEIVRERKRITINCTIEADSEAEFQEKAIDEAIEGRAFAGDDIEEYYSDIRVQLIVLSPEEIAAKAQKHSREKLQTIGYPTLFSLETVQP